MTEFTAMSFKEKSVLVALALAVGVDLLGLPG
jgi:hypothetical protein